MSALSIDSTSLDQFEGGLEGGSEMWDLKQQQSIGIGCQSSEKWHLHRLVRCIGAIRSVVIVRLSSLAYVMKGSSLFLTDHGSHGV